MKNTFKENDKVDLNLFDFNTPDSLQKESPPFSAEGFLQQMIFDGIDNNLGGCSMSSVYQFVRAGGKLEPRTFYSYLVSKYPAIAGLDDGVELLLEPLSQFDNDWWSQAARIVSSALIDGGIDGLLWRLYQTFSCFEELSHYRLHFRCRTASISQAWRNADEQDREKYFGTQSRFAKHLIQQRELVARELLIHSLPGNERVSLFTRGLMKDHRANMSNMMSKTWVGAIGSKATVKNLADSSRRKSAAEYLHISDELPDYYINDLGYICLWSTFTLPREYHPGGYAGETDSPWLAAGRMTPKDGDEELMKRHRRLHDACRDSGIKLHGRWDIQAHDDGTSHMHEVAFFINKTQADEYRRHASRIFPDHHSAFTVSKNAVIKQLETAQEARDKLAYAGRHRWHDQRTATADVSGKGKKPEVHPDEIWGELWSIKQHHHFGQKPLENWRLMQELDPKLMGITQYRDALPPAVTAVYDSANGPTRSYRQFLNLTEFTAPCGGLHLTFKRDDQTTGPVITLVDLSSSVNVSVSLTRDQWDRLVNPEQRFNFMGFARFLQLAITHPSVEPEILPPPPPPTKKRPRFDFLRR